MRPAFLLRMVVVMGRIVVVIVPMGIFVLTMDMGVAVDVLMFMGVCNAVVVMIVAVNVYMLVGVLQGNGVLHHQYGGSGHDGKTNEKLNTGTLTGEEQAKGYTQEWCDRIIGAGFCSAQIFLCLNVEIDA